MLVEHVRVFILIEGVVYLNKHVCNLSHGFAVGVVKNGFPPAVDKISLVCILLSLLPECLPRGFVDAVRLLKGELGFISVVELQELRPHAQVLVAQFLLVVHVDPLSLDSFQIQRIVNLAFDVPWLVRAPPISDFFGNQP